MAANAPSTRRPALAALIAALLASGCGGGGDGAGGLPPAPPITPLAAPCPISEVPPITLPPGASLLDRLRALPDVASVEQRADQPPFFVLSFDQPVDHCDPASPRFTQWATLRYLGSDRPTVLHTSGYDLNTASTGVFRLTDRLGANQVRLEHRFFTRSTPPALGPEGPDWSKLDVFQAATDQHRVTRNLQALLDGPWIDTGGSKGGMTAVFRRAYYPDDVRATLADVAPVCVGLSDPRYAAYLDAIGPADCRAGLKATQRALLDAAAEVKPLMVAAAAASVPADGYTRLDPDPAVALDRAFRFAVVELPFAFWQYGTEARCADVPAAGATPADLFAFMESVFGVISAGRSGTAEWIGDAALDFYAAYYYQSATQLGGPAYPEAHLLDLLGPDGSGDLPDLYTPVGVSKPFDPDAMPDVEAWVRAHGDRMMFVYGERDPWSGGQYSPGPGRDAVKFIVPGGNHGASIFALSGADRVAAETTLERWMGVPITLQPARAAAAPGPAPAPPADEEPAPRRWRL